MSESIRELESRGAEAEVAALRDGCGELGVFLQRLALALASNRLGEFTAETTGGASVARERQLPTLLGYVNAEVGRLTGLASRHSGRLLAAAEANLAADLAQRRRAAQRRVYGPISETGHVQVLTEPPPTDLESSRHG